MLYRKADDTGYIRADKLNEIATLVGVPVFEEQRVRMWSRNGCLKDKTAYRGCILTLSLEDYGIKAGHSGVLAHRNMSRGTLAYLRDKLRDFGRETVLPTSSETSRRKPKSELKPTGPSAEVSKEQKERDGFYASIRKALRANLP